MRKKLILLGSFLMAALLALGTMAPMPVQAATFQIDFETESAAICLVNVDTGTEEYKKNADERRAQASLTKVMTFIVASEHITDPENTKITASEFDIHSLDGTGSSMANVLAGETFSALDWYYALMVPSGNDAAMVLADFVGGGCTGETSSQENINNFVQMMNDKAQEMGLTNTHFANPHGLDQENHYTSARDSCTIAQYAMQLSHFMDIVTTSSYELPDSNLRTKAEIDTLYSTNFMQNPQYEEYYYEYVKGIKTGTETNAGRCIVTSANNGKYTYICTALGAPDQNSDGTTVETNGAMLDTKKLYQWAFENLEIKPIVNMDVPVTEIGLELAWQRDTLKLMPESNLSVLLPKDIEISSIIATPNEDVPESVVAPVTKGQVLGSATLSYANQELGTIQLIADEDIPRSDLLYYLQGIRDVVTNKWFIFAVIVFVILFIVYLIISTIYNRRNRRRRRVKNYRRL